MRAYLLHFSLLCCWLILPTTLFCQGPVWDDSLSVSQWTDSLLDKVEEEPDFAFTSLMYHTLENEALTPRIQYQLWFALGEYFQMFSEADSIDYTFQQAVDIAAQEWGDPSHTLSNALNGLTIARFVKGDRKGALAYARKVIAMREEVLPSSHSDLAQAHNNFGLMLFRLSRFDSALYHLEAAISVWESADSIPYGDLVTAYNNMGILTGNLGDDREAIRWYEQILTYEEHLPESAPAHKVSLAAIYNNIGVCYRRMGDTQRGISYQRQSLALASTNPIQDYKGFATRYENLGMAYLRINKPDSARECVEQGLAYKKAGNISPDDFTYADSYLLLGNINLVEGKPKKALDIFMAQEAPIIREFGKHHVRYSTLLGLIGECYLAMGDTTVGMVWMRKSLKSRKALYPVGHPLILDQVKAVSLNMPTALASEALRLLQEEMPLGEVGPESEASLTITPSLVSYWGEIGRRYRHLGDLHASWEAYEKAFGYLNELRREFQLSGSEKELLAEARPVLAGGIETALKLAEQGNTDYVSYAFALSEQSRSILLRESLQGLRAQEFAHLPVELQLTQQQLRRELVRLDRRIARASERSPSQVEGLRKQRFALLQQQDSLISVIEAEHPRYHQLRFDLQGPDVGKVEQILGGRGEDLIQYFIEGKKAFAFVLRPDTLLAITLHLSEDVEASITSLQEALMIGPTAEGDASRTLFAKHASSLYQQLFAPIKAAVPDLREQLIIVPDGKLGYIPFPLLLTAASAQQVGWRDLPYLLKDHVVSYAYTTTLLDVSDWSGNQPDQRLFVALAPEFGPNQVQLSYNQAEARQVAKRFRGELWVGGKAGETRFKTEAGKYRLIHISSHAALDDRSPLNAYIQMGATDQDDGRLEIAELFGLNLPADLVVLGACETGTGEYQRGEGIVSLAWGFSYAGVKSVLTTLWPVSDAATADLMDTYYAELLRGNARSQALRTAQLKMLEQADDLASHPFFWGGFQLMGDTQPIPLPTPYAGRLGLILGVIALVIIGVFVSVRRKKRQPTS